MREIILIERKRRLENFLYKVETTSPPPHLAGRWTKNLFELYIGYLRAKDPEWPDSKITYANALKPFNDRNVYMYVHTPVQERVNKARKKLSRKQNIKCILGMVQTNYLIMLQPNILN